jgi:hypothetical protein
VDVCEAGLNAAEGLGLLPPILFPMIFFDDALLSIVYF